MNYELGGWIAFVFVVAASFAFWGRGIIRGRKGDIVAGLAIFVFICVLLLAGSGTSAVFELVGLLLMLFGVVTLITGCFAKPDCPLPRPHRIALGFAAIILGLIMGMIV